MDIPQVIERVKVLKNLKNDKDIAALIGISANDFSNRKKRGTLLAPFVEWGLNENVDLNWLLTGDENFNQSAETQSPEGPVEIDLLSEVIKGVEDFLKSRKLVLDPDPKARLVAILYDRFAESGKGVDQKTFNNYLELFAA